MRKIISGLAYGFLLMLAISGCSSLRLHSETRDKQGQASQQALKKIDLSGMFTIASENLKKQLQTELDSQDRMGAAIRARELEAIVLSKSMHDSLVEQLDNRLMKLTGASTWQDAQRRMQQSRNTAEYDDQLKTNQESVAKIFQLNGLPVPDCGELAGGKIPTPISKALSGWRKDTNKIKLASIAGNLEQARKICAQILTSKSQWTVFAESEFEKDLTRAKQDQDEYDGLKKSFEKLSDAYKTARKNYDAAVKDATSEPGTVKLVAAKAAVLEKAIGNLDQANDALSIQFISKERIDAVQKFVDVVLQGAADGKVPENASEAQAAFILIPQQVDDFKSALAAAKTPLIEPLAIRKNFEQIKLDAATRELALRQSRADLAGRIVDAQYSEMQALDRASRQLHGPTTGSQASLDDLFGDRAVVEVFGKVSGADATLLYDATATYLDDLVRLKPAIYKLKYQRLATYHQISLIYAETNARHWMNLISASVAQVAESASNGIKPDNVAQAIQAAALFWIAHGVN